MIEPLRDGRPRRRASPWVRALGSITLLGSATAAGCQYEPEPCLADLEEGDLVVTEIRGPQDGTWGEWIELYNATDETLDLRGLRGSFERLSGAEIQGESELTFLIRDSLELEAGGYAVLGSRPLRPRAPAIDYSFNADFRVEPEVVEASGGTVILPESENADPVTMFGNARFRLFSCERTIESVDFPSLPRLGTLSYDGARVPDAADNDNTGDDAYWCTDDLSEPLEGWDDMGVIGMRPGTPGEPNVPCAAQSEEAP